MTNETTYLVDYIRKNTELFLSEGEIFGGNGTDFIRWNYACPRSLLEQGIARFVKGIN